MNIYFLHRNGEIANFTEKQRLNMYYKYAVAIWKQIFHLIDDMAN